MSKLEVWKRKMAKQENKKKRNAEDMHKLGQYSSVIRQDLVKAGYYS